MSFEVRAKIHNFRFVISIGFFVFGIGNNGFGLGLHLLGFGLATIGLALVCIFWLWGWQTGFGLRLHFWLCGCQQIVWASSPFSGFVVGNHGLLQYFCFGVGNYGFGFCLHFWLWVW
jgi:hypothetical protein